MRWAGPRFRDYLIDELRPELASDYRMDPRDYGFAGFSGGASFGLFTEFTRPEGFTNYVLGSPGAAHDYLRTEAEYVDDHSDLSARVFFAAGENEGRDPWTVSGEIWSTVASVTEALTRRGYPSLELITRVLPGLDHFSAWPVVYIEGGRAVWRES